jgi:hypothetical protein
LVPDALVAKQARKKHEPRDDSQDRDEERA